MVPYRLLDQTALRDRPELYTICPIVRKPPDVIDVALRGEYQKHGAYDETLVALRRALPPFVKPVFRPSDPDLPILTCDFAAAHAIA